MNMFRLESFDPWSQNAGPPVATAFSFTFRAGREGGNSSEGRGQDRTARADALRAALRDRRRKTRSAWCAGALAEREPAQDWVDLWQAVLDRLKENAALLQRLSALEASGTHTAPSAIDITAATAAARSSTTTELVPRASWAAVCQGKDQLEDELRLRQVFVAKTAEFREALSAILGVKVAFYDNGQVRVTSQYDLGAAFIFQPAPWDAAKDNVGNNLGAARMQLVAQGEGGPQELPQLMRNWVEIEQSMPCFLASVTLECYDKWKREHEMSGVGE
jgi:mitotic spindle assembly checkpoint protein MAD1